MNEMVEEMGLIFNDLNESIDEVEHAMDTTALRSDLELIDQELREKLSMIAEYRKLTPNSLDDLRTMLVSSEHKIILLLEKVSRKMAAPNHEVTMN